jgi:penicillin-binding protein 2
MSHDTEPLEEDEIPYEQRDHAWFVAAAPADKFPRIAVSVIIEHGGHGGSAAAPVAQRIIRAYLKGE